jgi:hypothetical protein
MPHELIKQRNEIKKSMVLEEKKRINVLTCTPEEREELRRKTAEEFDWDSIETFFEETNWDREEDWYDEWDDE